MKKVLVILSLVVITGTVQAQTKETSSAIVSFDATTPKDALPKAESKTVIGLLNTTTGEIGFEAAVNSFTFTNPMIQDHFNGEKWMHSQKFPLFSFTGKVTDLSKVNFAKNGTYTVPVSGDLTIKDITKPVSTTVTVKVEGGTVNANTEFSIKLADYGIKGVPIDAGKVAKEPTIRVSASLK